jgi:hypothetical protein
MNITELPSIMKSLVDSVKDLKQISNTKDNIEVPEIVESADVAPTTMPSSSAGTVDDNRDTEDVPPVVKFQDSTQDMDIEKFNNDLKELDIIGSRLRRSGGISDRTIAKLIDWDVITSEMSFNLIRGHSTRVLCPRMKFGIDTRKN